MGSDQNALLYFHVKMGFIVLIASKQLNQYFWFCQRVGDTKIIQNDKDSFDLFRNKLCYVVFI